MAAHERRRRAPNITRDGLLWLLGFLALGKEMVADARPDPTVIGAAMILLGVPIAQRIDQGRKKSQESSGDGSAATP